MLLNAHWTIINLSIIIFQIVLLNRFCASLLFSQMASLLVSPSWEICKWLNKYFYEVQAVWLVFFERNKLDWQLWIKAVECWNKVVTVIFSGVIELCRRLGHEAFGEEDDEVQYAALPLDLSL